MQIPDHEKICIIIPAYKVEAFIEDVIASIPAWVWRIIVVNDASPDKVSQKVSALNDPRVILVEHQTNQGVGGAMLTGYAVAAEAGATILVKMDGDMQMDASYLPHLVQPILDDKAHYVKGNRFIEIETIHKMPAIRRLGNFGLSFLTKLASGYWNIFDPTNGYTALDIDAYHCIHSDKIHKRYFFESSMLIELSLSRAVVMDIPMHACYDHNQSSLSITKSLLQFPFLLIRSFLRRVWLQYFVLDFSLGSLFLVMGSLLSFFGFIWGIWHWIISSLTKIPATTGTVMLAAIPFTIGVELYLQAIVYDLQTMPTMESTRVVSINTSSLYSSDSK